MRDPSQPCYCRPDYTCDPVSSRGGPLTERPADSTRFYGVCLGSMAGGMLIASAGWIAFLVDLIVSAQP